jgi:hypothetical protein
LKKKKRGGEMLTSLADKINFFLSFFASSVI